jgi:hypothetical protein
MFRIASVGWVHPRGVITDDVLAKVGITPSEDQRLLQRGIRHRYTVCPQPFISRNGEVTPEQMKERFAVTAEPLVEMAVEAARIALQRAGVTVDDIGFVLGDSATPIETIPAFAALVAGRLGAKVPAYDVTGISGAIPLQLQTLLGWREEVVAPITLLVSANTPSAYLSYAEGDESSWVLGDSAGAMIVEKTKERRGVIVEDARFRRVGAGVSAAEEIYGLIRGQVEPSGALLDLIQELSDEISLEGLSSWIIASPTLRSGHAIDEMLGGSGDTFCWCGDEGFSFGSTLFRGVERLLNDAEWSGKALICALGPDGAVGVARLARMV